MATITHHHGRCHCGNIEATLESFIPLREFEVRACDCSFCYKHGARVIADPQGAMTITVHDPNKLNRYQFALKTAEFLVCSGCGVYVAALFKEGDHAFAILNVNTLEGEGRTKLKPAMTVNYDQETEVERRHRRHTKWTPVRELKGVQ